MCSRTLWFFCKDHCTHIHWSNSQLFIGPDNQSLSGCIYECVKPLQMAQWPWNYVVHMFLVFFSGVYKLVIYVYLAHGVFRWCIGGVQERLQLLIKGVKVVTRINSTMTKEGENPRTWTWQLIYEVWVALGWPKSYLGLGFLCFHVKGWIGSFS
jgi:hypothetical protein